MKSGAFFELKISQKDKKSRLNHSRLIKRARIRKF
ncbi:hypothetical protein HPSH_04750 [Helicobacter pylori Shi470]|nr:hypothetical protein HPSH_04750 [Helicobacter pylori Shi470]